MRATLLTLFLLTFAISTVRAAGPAGPLRPTWDNLGGVLTSDVSCTSFKADRIDCFARGTNNALWHIWWGGAGWSRWESLGGVIASAPECVSWGANRLDCFAIGQNGAMWHKWWGGAAGWGDWEDLGGEPTSPLRCLTRGRDRIDCFALDRARAVLHLLGRQPMERLDASHPHVRRRHAEPRTRMHLAGRDPHRLFRLRPCDTALGLAQAVGWRELERVGEPWRVHHLGAQLHDVGRGPHRLLWVSAIGLA